jgi:hypothetical protein
VVSSTSSGEEVGEVEVEREEEEDGEVVPIEEEDLLAELHQVDQQAASPSPGRFARPHKSRRVPCRLLLSQDKFPSKYASLFQEKSV